MRIRTLPVYSRRVDDEAHLGNLAAHQPSGFRLARHQLQTYQALRDPQVDVIINTAMTGDGKSLAGQLGALVDHQPLLSLYPTNELIRDQMRQVERTLQDWKGTQSLRQDRLYSRRLDELMAQGDFTQRGNALLKVLKNADIVLTNPDILHYIMQFYYVRHNDAPDLLAPIVADLFDVFVFDEFHVFDTPQVVAVLNAMLLIDEITRQEGRLPKKFVFLSATPDKQLVEYLNRAGMRYQIIEGEYRHSWEDPGAGWRRILHGSDIDFAKGGVEDWMEANLEDTVLSFLRAHRPGVKGAVIVNSVASAKRLVQRLRARLEPEGLTVGENTGFTGDETRRLSYATDLLVGTSTIDVGVDFDINFLVFESRDAGSFLQRLGRLGRHAGYTRDGAHHAFHTFEAHALVPSFIYERLFAGHDQADARLQPDGVYNREALAAVIRDVFPPSADFGGYAREWGGLQSFQVINQLRRPIIRDSFTGARERLAARYEATFKIKMGREGYQFKELAASKPAILEEARSFRGGSSFACGVVDMTETGAERFKAYDLFGLLRNCQTDLLDRDEFDREAAESGVAVESLRPDNWVGCFRLYSFLPEARPVGVYLNRHDVGAWSTDRFGKVNIIKGIEVNVAGMTTLNSSLARREFVALLCLCHPAELQRSLRLPFPFPIHVFEARDGTTGSIAFGREALLLQVAIQQRRFPCGGGAIFC